MKAVLMDGITYNGFGKVSQSEIRIRENRKWRMEVVRRQRIVLASFIAAVAFMAILFSASLMIKAQDNTYEPTCKYYTVANVHAGDTLWVMAQKYYSEENYKNYDAFITEICKINHLESPEDLKAGENVVIPYYDVYK
jgi:hypothetical protein